MKPVTRRFPNLPALACLLLAASVSSPGCEWWHNFSTYFNTLYLAQVHLETYEAQQKAIVPASTNGAVAVTNHRWLDEEYQMRELAKRDGRTIAITPSFSQSLIATKQVTNIHLDSAIILGSKILADKKGNRYQEDALFVVGKAEFYKNDFATARRKFLELLFKYPDTRYSADVSIFLARSMISGREFDTAGIALDKGLASAQKTGDPQQLSAVHRARAEYIFARNSDSLAAIASELKEAESGLSGEELARLAFEEGAVQFLSGDWSAAARAFEVVANSAKDDWLVGEGHVQHALALRHLQKYPEAIAELQTVTEKARFGPSHAAARYELALTHELADRHAVDDDLRSQLFREKYHPSLNASYHAIDTSYNRTSALMMSHARFRQAELYREMGQYDSAAKLAASLINTKDFAVPAMNDYVAQHATSLASFSKWRAELAHCDSLQRRATPPTRRISEDAEIHNRALREVVGDRWRPEVPPELTTQDSIRILATEARLKRERANAITIADTASFIDSVHFRAAHAHYQLGRAYETFQELTAARAEYRSALSYGLGVNDSTKAFLAQTLYAWMQLERRDKNIAVSDSLLDELLSHHGQTIYAEQARSLFARASRNSKGELAYSAAYRTLRESGIAAAIAPLLAIAHDFPQEDVAPRALYAIGLTFEETERYDSTRFYYRRLVADYPYSVYANAIKPRIGDRPSAPAPPPNIDPTLVTPEQAEQQRKQAEERRRRDQENQRRARPNRPGIPSPGSAPGGTPSDPPSPLPIDTPQAPAADSASSAPDPSAPTPPATPVHPLDPAPSSPIMPGSPLPHK